MMFYFMIYQWSKGIKNGLRLRTLNLLRYPLFNVWK